MKTKREDVIKFLAGSQATGAEQFNQAFEMFRNSDNRNPTQERNLNKNGYSETNLRTVVYEIQKLHGITDSEIRKAKKALVPVTNVLKEAFLKLDKEIQYSILVFIKLINEFASIPLDSITEEFRNKTEGIRESYIGFVEGPDLTVDLEEEFRNEMINEVNTTEYPSDLIEDILELRRMQAVNSASDTTNIKVNDVKEVTPETLEATKAKVTQAFETAPDEVKQEIKFRDEFPFISDLDLPAELKQLVTEKFNHYYAFASAHTSLTAGLPAEDEKLDTVTLTNEEIFKLAKAAVTNFQMDQLIREEFVYYKENKKVLGVHPIFKQRKLQETVNSMTTAELARRAPLLENYIRRDKNNADKAKNEADKLKFTNKVTDWEFELALVNVKLGHSAGK